MFTETVSGISLSVAESRFSAIFPPSFFARLLCRPVHRLAHFPGSGGGIPPEGETGARFGGGGGS